MSRRASGIGRDGSALLISAPSLIRCFPAPQPIPQPPGARRAGCCRARGCPSSRASRRRRPARPTRPRCACAIRTTMAPVVEKAISYVSRIGVPSSIGPRRLEPQPPHERKNPRRRRHVPQRTCASSASGSGRAASTAIPTWAGSPRHFLRALRGGLRFGRMNATVLPWRASRRGRSGTPSRRRAWRSFSRSPRGSGLTRKEAAARLTRLGPNRLRRRPPKPAWKLFLEQFRSLLIVVLLVASALAAVVGDIKDAVVILTVVLLNAFLGFLQEHRAEAAVTALKRMLVGKARVGAGVIEIDVERDTYLGT